MAPESISNGTYSKRSDVWTFGIVGMFSLFFILKLSFRTVCFWFELRSIEMNKQFDFDFFIDLVYEIVARCEPHELMDILDVAMKIRFVFFQFEEFYFFLFGHCCFLFVVEMKD
jgi:serine/threonine protein kinase